jgi:hypothetical protein
MRQGAASCLVRQISADVESQLKELVAKFGDKQVLEALDPPSSALVG